MKKPFVKSFQRFSEDLAAVSTIHTRLLLNRPIYAGMVILDLAKLLMYDFYYNVIKKRYNDKVKLLFTDTDSLCLEIKTNDLYADMKDFHSELDCSEYPQNHPLHNSDNKKVLGKFKDEMCGNIVHEYVGLRSKMYSISWEHGSARTCKGISKTVNKFVLRHDMYKSCLTNCETRRDRMTRIGSELHKLYTFDISKISLSPIDDKRFVLDDKVNTLAYGHYMISQ